jgi:hypothetical protein
MKPGIIITGTREQGHGLSTLWGIMSDLIQTLIPMAKYDVTTQQPQSRAEAGETVEHGISRVYHCVGE